MNLRTRRSQKQQNKQKKGTVMKMRINLLSKIILSSALAIVLAFVSGCSDSDNSHDSNHPGNHGNPTNHMN